MYFPAINKKKEIESSLVKYIFEVYDEVEKYGLKDRVGQMDMSLDIAEAFSNNQNIMVEAGVGIGKSFGYLIPALFINDYFRYPVIIATSSIQLSEQLLNDVHFISEKLGYNVSAIVGKGMGNYACRLKAMDMFSDSRNQTRYSEVWHLIKDVAEGKIKERSDIKEGVKDGNWKSVNVGKCIYEKCDYRQECDYYQMRTNISNRVFGMDFVIVNQDLLIRDLIQKNENGKGFIMENPSLIIIDEAHNLEEKVRSALTDTFSRVDIATTIKRVDLIIDSRYNDLENIDDIKELLEINEKMFREIEKQIKNLMRISSEESERYKIEFPKSVNYSEWNRIINNLIVSVSVYESGKREREVDELFEKLNSLKRMYDILYGIETNYLIWAVANNEKKEMFISISFCPKKIQKILEDNLFQRKTPVLMTSATLCQNAEDTAEKYSYIKNATGFIGELSEPKISPFDYDKNAIVYIANDLPLYNHEEKQIYLDAITSRIIDLCDITNGRTLVLFSAKEDLRYITQKLLLIETKWDKIIQKEGSNQDSAINEFRSTKGVLFGTGIFWEGINIEGSDLSQVIIIRLPFPVPNDPIIEYKTSISKDSFREVMLPEMLIKIRQGSGRLIRSENDKGILSILDSRLSIKSNKKYRKDVIDVLPFKNYTENLIEVNIFAKLNIV